MMAKVKQGNDQLPPASATGPPDLRTYYEQLGVRASASPSDIRRAYLALIKRHHPDVTGSDNLSDTARAINQAYRALSDPARRGRYDAQLGIAHAVVLRPMPPAPPPRRHATLWTNGLAAFSLAGVVGCYLAYALRVPAEVPRLATAVTPDVTDRDTVRSRRAAVVQQAGLNFEWLALQSDVGAAEHYSQECWNSLLASGSDGLFDYCLAFDAVAERTFGADRVYFAATALLNRARAASGGRLAHGESLQQRLARIDALLARERRVGPGISPSAAWFPIQGGVVR